MAVPKPPQLTIGQPAPSVPAFLGAKSKLEIEDSLEEDAAVPSRGRTIKSSGKGLRLAEQGLWHELPVGSMRAYRSILRSQILVVEQIGRISG